VNHRHKPLNIISRNLVIPSTIKQLSRSFNPTGPSNRLIVPSLLEKGSGGSSPKLRGMLRVLPRVSRAGGPGGANVCPPEVAI
jgi:hypothetical protein